MKFSWSLQENKWTNHPKLPHQKIKWNFGILPSVPWSQTFPYTGKYVSVKTRILSHFTQWDLAQVKKKARKNGMLLRAFKWMNLLMLIWNFNSSRSNPGQRKKIKLNFYFHTSLWCLKSFYEGLKAFIKPFEASKRSVIIKI